ncbi:MAG: thiamine pyrophosphate-binding protein [Pseudorhodobacter sp.]|nr:thiamine pyrophosphate-binding protein [Pseudorhodobacter sp.]
MSNMFGGQAVVESLYAEGVETVFGVLGSTLLPVYDALVGHPMQLITPRSEDGAGHMADAYARVKGSPGVVLSTAGPGAAGVAAAMGEAYAESWPMLHIATQVPTPYLDKQKGVYHDGPNQRQIFRSVSVWDHRVERAEEIPEAIQEAFRIMRSGRPRPVFLEIPADLLRHSGRFRIATGPTSGVTTELDLRAVDAAAKMLAESKAPVIWAGGGCVKAGAGPELLKLAEMLEAPVLCTNGSKGIVSDDHPLALGNMATVSDTIRQEVLGQGDVMLGIGTRFSQRATDWWRLETPPRLIHADVDPAEFNLNLPADITVQGDAKAFLSALIDNLRQRGDAAPTWGLDRVAKIKAKSRAELCARHPEEFAMLERIRQSLPRDAIIAAQSTLGHWCRFGLDCYEPRKFMFASSYGSMGFAFHAAIGAKIAAPEKTVAAFCGDGGFMMGCGELATIAQLGLNIPIVIVNNGGFGILRARQTKNFGRTIGTDLINPDFLKLAAAFDFEASRIKDLSQLGTALKKALESGKPQVIEVPVLFGDYRAGAIQ